MSYRCTQLVTTKCVTSALGGADVVCVHSLLLTLVSCLYLRNGPILYGVLTSVDKKENKKKSIQIKCNGKMNDEQINDDNTMVSRAVYNQAYCTVRVDV